LPNPQHLTIALRDRLSQSHRNKRHNVDVACTYFS
jgi:hypothetical protein